MKHPAIWLAAALAAAGCGGMDYRDSTGAADANPLCVSDPNQPNEPMSEACRRAREATWSSERKSEPVDFGKDDD